LVTLSISVTLANKKEISMRKIIFISVVLMAKLFAPSFIQAQGTLYVSNLGQPTVGGMGIGSDSWVAQYFTTGTNSNGYIVDSIQLLMGAASGDPSGFMVAIYSSPGNGAPGASLGSLSGSDPSAGGLFTYTTSGIMLSPSSFYFVVATATTPLVQGVYNWSAANSFGRITTSPGDPWTIQDAYYNSTDGLNWTFIPRENVSQFAIYATVVPEPAMLALAALGLAAFALSFWRRKSER
jgi:hypothetical protein